MTIALTLAAAINTRIQASRLQGAFAVFAPRSGGVRNYQKHLTSERIYV
jgi:hypothetical protein